MRCISLILVLLSAVAAVGQQPKRNPFRDGSGKVPEIPPAVKRESNTDTDALKNAPKVLRGAEVGVGRLVPDVAFTDLAGKSGKLSDFKGSKFTVLAFTNTTCPLCKKYAPSLARIEKEYAAKGIAFLFVNPTATDEPKEIPFAGRYVHDKDGTLTAAVNGTSTTEVVVLDAARTVIYRGAIDDQYGLGYATDAPKNTYLISALDDALVGKPPVITATTAPGCVLEPDAKKVPAIPLTYHARIERIIQANCVECHRSGGVSPFSLTTYDEVVANKAMLKRVVNAGTMPPWFAVVAKTEHSPFANDRSLTESDKNDLITWLSGDLKKGDAADAPLPRSFESGWLIGKPDVVYQLPKPIAIKAEGTMPYQNVRVDTDFDEDRWVQALEVQPSAREVVHHVLVFAGARGGRISAGEASGYFAAYVPGNNTLIYPDGYAKKLPKKATLLFQIHYTPNGKATTDQTRLGLVFAKEAPRHEVLVAGIANATFQIPAGADNHQISARIPVPFDAKVLALFPHAHLRGKAARYEVKSPDGKTEQILNVPRYDFNWQLQYRFTEPVSLSKGSTITYTAWYDNSDKNPANPDPKKNVRWGQQTHEEMHLGYVEYVIDSGSSGSAKDTPKLGAALLGARPDDFKFPKEGVAIPEQAKALISKFDTNENGRLDADEFEKLPDVAKNGVLEYAWRITR